MEKLTLEGLKKLRESAKNEMEKSNSSNKEITILVGMGSCGIAAGANETMRTFSEQVEKMGLKNIIIKPTGCMGSCYVEPTVEVIVPGMPQILYGKVNSDTAKKILEQHILHKQLVDDHVFDKPAADIISK